MWVGAVENRVPKGTENQCFVLCKVCFADLKQVKLVALWQRTVKVKVLRYDADVVYGEAFSHDVEQGADEGLARRVALELGKGL